MARFFIIETGLWDVPRNEMIQAETPEIYQENRRHTISGYAILIRDRQRGKHARVDHSELGVSGWGVILQNLWTAFLLMTSTGFIIASTYNPFLYFRF